MSDRIDPSGWPAAESFTDDWVARAVFDRALDSLMVLDHDDKVLACNQSFLTLWNFPPDTVAHRDALEMRAWIAQQLVDPTRYVRSPQELSQANPPYLIDEVALKDGRVFERHVSLLQRAGENCGLVIRWRDISARHRAEQALAQSQARLSAVVENALNAILLAGDDGCYVEANPAACELTGYAREELLAMSVWQLVVPDSVDINTLWSGFLQAGSSRGRVQLRRKDGEMIIVAFNAKAQVLPGLHLSIMMDVTEEVRAQQRLESQALTDALTGISNRRHFLSLAADELARASRHGAPLALLMIDLDHFKAINDQHGHAVGDEVLRTFSQTVSSEIRQGEHFARLGGEEFAVLLPHTDLKGATLFARRLVEKVREQPAERAGTRVHFTASIGVAALAAGAAAAASIEHLMAMADRALYRGKAGGRDRVEVSDGAP